MTHIVLSLRPPYPERVTQWLVDEIIHPVRAELPADQSTELPAPS